MLARVADALVTDLTHIDRVSQQGIKSSTRERLTTRFDSIFGDTDLRVDAISVEFFLEQPHATELTIAREDMSHGGGFGFVYDQLAVAHLVPERHQAAHPDTLALGGGDLVADALAGHLPLELREREQDV